MTKSISIYCSYAHKDKEFRNELVAHIGKNSISEWYDREIFAETDWEDEIDPHLENAQLILLLVSVDFIASDYPYGKEMRKALEKHSDGEAIVIPIIIRPVDWRGTPFDQLQALPTGGKPVGSWANTDEAFTNVALGIHKAINTLLKQQYIANAVAEEERNQYEAALTAYNQALDITPNDFMLLQEKGNILFKLGRLTEALDIYTLAIKLAPNDASLYKSKGDILFALSQFDQALLVYTKAIQLNPQNAQLDQVLLAYDKAILLSPNDAKLHTHMGDIYTALSQLDLALLAYDKAILLNPNDAQLHAHVGDIYTALSQLDLALLAYDKAILLSPNSAQFLRNIATTLMHAKRFDEALHALEEAINREPNNPYIYKEYGDILFELGRLTEANTAFDNAIRLKSNFAPAYVGKGKVLEELAKQSYARLIELAHQSYEKANKLRVETD